MTAFAAMGGFLFLNTLYLQDVRGFSPLAAGPYLLPMAVTMAVCAPLAGRIVAARGARIPLVISGLALIAGGVHHHDRPLGAPHRGPYRRRLEPAPPSRPVTTVPVSPRAMPAAGRGCA